MIKLMAPPSNTPMTPPSAGKHNCFGEELPDDVATARAERFAYADFARPLGHGHQHDVHYAYAANQKADGADHGD